MPPEHDVEGDASILGAKGRRESAKPRGDEQNIEERWEKTLEGLGTDKVEQDSQKWSLHLGV